ncbi:MAG TPA: hypothetical protein VK889_00140 [Solirubrobacterales bacterium]|nr:hypothetical protein [Solirubrobacterales bacterium]
MLESGLVAQATHTLGTDVLAAGELRQGKAPAADAVASFGTLFEVLRPRRSKALPKRFTLAVTEDRVAAIKSNSIGSMENGDYRVFLRGGEQGSWPRSEVFIEAANGGDSIGGILHVGGEAVPVFRPLISGDEETDALFALLAR